MARNLETLRADCRYRMLFAGASYSASTSKQHRASAISNQQSAISNQQSARS
jgi:hypothetical protein